MVDLATPNLLEAADLLAADPARTEDEMADQVAALAGMTNGVLLKGGHLGGTGSPDLLLASGMSQPVRLTAPRIATRNTHGTGCTLSAAIAALRPQRDTWLAAVTDAKRYLTAALSAAERLTVGGGHGPLHHFHSWWPAAEPADTLV